MIDRATIEKIQDAARIEEVVGDFVTLKRAGAGFKGLCPFHDDRTPSFVVTPSRNYCKCFACGEGGNPVTFIMKHEQLSYPDALRYLARKYNIEIKEKQLTEEERLRGDDRESMFILNEWARKWFIRQLRETEDGRNIGMTYLRGRGFRDDVIEKFQVGYCPDSRTTSLAQEALKAGFQERYLINTPDPHDISKSVGTGLAFKTERHGLRDRFAGRVIWPIMTISGKVAGFGGRVLDAATKGVNMKYQNSPESIVYSKRRELYGLFQAKHAISRENLCYLVEGYTDVMGMHQSGVENVVASSGTALTDDQIRLIHRLCENIVLVYDADPAGIKASMRGIDMLLRQGMNVRVLLLPEGEDPDSLSRKLSSAELKAYLKDHQTDFIKFKTDLLMDEAKGDPVALSRLIAGIVQSMAMIPDEITRSLYVRETAQALGMKEELVDKAVRKQLGNLREEWRRQKERGQSHAAGQSTSPGNAEPTPEPEPVPLPLPKAMDVQPQPQNNHLMQIEREMIRAVITDGKETVGQMDTGDGALRDVTLAEYVKIAMQQDGLRMTTPLFHDILQETIDRMGDGNFNPERHFMNHPNAQISALTFALVTEKQQVSRLYADGEDMDTCQLVQHLLADYKLEVVKQQLKGVTQELQDPNVASDTERYTEVMSRFMRLKDVERKLSHMRGDRVMG